METDLHANENGLITRSFQFRAVNTEKREITGIGVPYGEIYDSGWGYREKFDPGSVAADGSYVLIWQHREPIGKVIATRETTEGFEITVKVSDTVQGRDAWTLVQDGAIDSFSIGFRMDEYRVEKDDQDREVIVHTRVQAKEFSLVTFPAYQSAKISEFRSAPPMKGNKPMETDVLTRAELDQALSPLSQGLEVVERQLAVIGTNTTTGPTVPEFRNFGEFTRAIANGDEAAIEFHRAFAGGTLADTVVKDSWVGKYVKFVAARRRMFNQFGTGVLPDEGSNVEFARLKSDTTKVGKQAAEGDELTYGGKIALKTDTAPKETVGAWTDMSYQSLKNATISVAEDTMLALLQKYASNSEKVVKDAYLALIAAQLASAEPDAFLNLAAAADTDDYLDLIVDAAVIYENRGHVLTGANVSVDVFKRLLRLRDGDRRLMNVYGTGVNMVGEMNLSQVDGSLAGLRFSLLDTKSKGKFAFYDPTALKTLESPGAPARLQEEDIKTLTKVVAVWGQNAVTDPFPDAILPVKLGA
ncbi:HK97 family phage prohead protease [Arthrobacter sp. GMC3]|uniref:HK97 family phage prohead protease n=1 Tax=Arthrobacter sp. GMC3 TaxID=2058894 RepID=UPI000CE33E79|nr:HK97 family phage prohead protease [Arthrobacter sp. GMC3]